MVIQHNILLLIGWNTRMIHVAFPTNEQVFLLQYAKQYSYGYYSFVLIHFLFSLVSHSSHNYILEHNLHSTFEEAKIDKNYVGCKMERF